MWRRWVSLLLIFTVVGCRATQEVKHIRFTDEGRVEETHEERLSRKHTAKDAVRGLSNAAIGGILTATAIVGVGALIIHEESRKDKDD